MLYRYTNDYCFLVISAYILLIKHKEIKKEILIGY